VKNLLKIAAAAAFVAVPMQASAVTGDVPFNGTVTHTCVINVNGGGTMVADASFQTLTSTAGVGAAAGTADIVATGNGFDVSIDVPSSFSTEPTADTTAETFNGAFSTTGATSVTGSAAGGANSGTGTDLNNGTTNVSVNLTATKAGTDVFEAGAYAATVVLRCE